MEQREGKQVLIIDDDAKLRQLLSRYLGQFGYRTAGFEGPREALEALERDGADLVLLDVMLPDMDGFEVLKAIRLRSAVPVIMLTARGETADRVLGLELGGDDYLPKPFDPRELVARIAAVLRRKAQPPRGQEVSVRGVVVDLSSYTARIDGRPLDLTAGECVLLHALVSRAGRVVGRERLAELLHGEETPAFDRSIDIMVSRLRGKLGDDPREGRYIKTVRGAGYLFVREEP